MLPIGKGKLLSQHRNKHFLEETKQGKKQQQNVRNFEASNLIPSKTELLQQFRRENYIASVWSNAHMKHPRNERPESNGGILKDSQYKFSWFDGDQFPSFVSESLENELEKSSINEDDCEDEFNIWFECEFEEGSKNLDNDEDEDE